MYDRVVTTTNTHWPAYRRPGATLVDCGCSIQTIRAPIRDWFPARESARTGNAQRSHRGP